MAQGNSDQHQIETDQIKSTAREFLKALLANPRVAQLEAIMDDFNVASVALTEVAYSFAIAFEHSQVDYEKISGFKSTRVLISEIDEQGEEQDQN